MAVSFTCAALAIPVAAQQALTLESFRPQVAHCEVRVDFARLIDAGVWDEVESSLLGGFLKQGEKELGLQFDGLLDLRFWIHIPETKEADHQYVRPHRVVVMSGAVGMPPDAERWMPETVGEYEAFTRGSGQQLSVLPHEQLFVTGSRSLIGPVLLGEARGGKPGGDQMSMLASRHKPLVYAFVDLPAARRSNGEFAFLTESEYPKDDIARYLVMRLDMVGEEDEEHLVLRAKVRHDQGKAGMEQTKEEANKAIAELRAMPQLKMLAPYLDKIEFEAKGTDYSAKVDLGHVRDAVGSMAQVMAPLLMMGREVQARAVAVEAKAAAGEALKAMLEAEKKAKAAAEKAKDR